MSTVYSVIQKYQNILTENWKFSFSDSSLTLGKVGIANRNFIFHLFNDKKMFAEFLRECGLIMNEIMCSKCGAPMKFAVANKTSDGFAWSCRQKYNEKICENRRSIRKGSWFSKSNLTMQELLLITYEIVKGTKNSAMEFEYCFSTHTTTHWRALINEKISDFMKVHLEKVGGSGKIVEIGISTFGKKINTMDAQWIFGGVEMDSEKLFLVAIGDKSQETLIDIIQRCVEEGTTIYFDSVSSYNDLDSELFNNLSVSYNLTYGNGTTDCTALKHTWRLVENALAAGNKRGKLKHNLDIYLFKKYCESKQTDCFNTFLEFVKRVNWED